MSLISLRDVGKIYVSEGSVAVGIRGVNLDLDIGEFVAVTGKSGSGKTTLLNILSGIDTYEEGQLYIEGEETAHYSQKDWEVYRQKYISFVFQEYNIIDSFSVLENVELALMYIDSAKERRRRALELIERVGLTKFKNHKGSKLSGGQKQRTVIARALAKDSPVILADEPTGNLDAQTSREIIELLHEISKDKLVVIVTHSFDEVREFATREIRIFDGSVERDEKLRNAEIKPLSHLAVENKDKGTIKKGIVLGAHRFRSMPKLSVFTCLLMIIAMLGSFFATALTISDLEAFEKNYMFTHINGRTVVVRQDGNPMTDKELSELAEKTGADTYLQYDHLLDNALYYRAYKPSEFSYYQPLRFSFDEKVSLDVGRMPKGNDEAVLVLPICFANVFGKDKIEKDTIKLMNVTLNVSGVSYYYDNTIEYGIVLLTREGFENISSALYLAQNSYKGNVSASIAFSSQSENFLANCDIGVDGTLKDNEAYITGVYSKYPFLEDKNGDKTFNYNISLNSSHKDTYTGETTSSKIDVGNLTLIEQKDQVVSDSNGIMETCSFFSSYGGYYASNRAYESMIYVSNEVAEKLVDTAISNNYTQGSLFYSNDMEANSKVSDLRNLGYVGVPSDATCANENTIILAYITAIFMIFLWVLMIAFLALFLSLCSSRVITSKKGDLAILRSMGIKNNVVKISMYVQMLISVIPSIIVLIISSLCIYLSPNLNPIVPFMHAPQYMMIILGIILITLLLTYRYNKKMFSESVRKTLKGGQRES